MNDGWRCLDCDARAAPGAAEDPSLVELSRELHEDTGHETVTMDSDRNRSQTA